MDAELSRHALAGLETLTSSTMTGKLMTGRRGFTVYHLGVEERGVRGARPTQDPIVPRPAGRLRIHVIAGAQDGGGECGGDWTTMTLASRVADSASFLSLSSRGSSISS